MRPQPPRHNRSVTRARRQAVHPGRIISPRKQLLYSQGHLYVRLPTIPKVVGSQPVLCSCARCLHGSCPSMHRLCTVYAPSMPANCLSLLCRCFVCAQSVCDIAPLLVLYAPSTTLCGSSAESVSCCPRPELGTPFRIALIANGNEAFSLSHVSPKPHLPEFL